MRILICATLALFFLAPAHTLAQGSHMPVGELTSQPIGHYEFCGTRVYAKECGPRSVEEMIRYTPSLWVVMQAINDEVNYGIEPKSDQDLYGRPEVWAYPVVYGDCEDYVLLKRRLLLQRGFPASALLLTVVRRIDNGEEHMVLTVVTTDGDYILDNIVEMVRPWADTREDYLYLKRQAESDSGKWVTIVDPTTTATSSTR